MWHFFFAFYIRREWLLKLQLIGEFVLLLCVVLQIFSTGVPGSRYISMLLLLLLAKVPSILITIYVFIFIV